MAAGLGHLWVLRPANTKGAAGPGGGGKGMGEVSGDTFQVMERNPGTIFLIKSAAENTHSLMGCERLEAEDLHSEQCWFSRRGHLHNEQRGNFCWQ